MPLKLIFEKCGGRVIVTNSVGNACSVKKLRENVDFDLAGRVQCI